MSRQPQLSSIDLWSDFERLCLLLLREALTALANRDSSENENDLNRHLYFAITHASQQAMRQGEYPPSVVPEGHSPPVASDSERAEREFKIPDFYWAYIDPHANDPYDASKQFVVECKRLAKPYGSYAHEYVKSGIARFIDVGHSYAKGMKSGAMAGYLQEVLVDDALASVNAVAASDSIPPLAMRGRNGEVSAEFDHDLNRSFPESPFRLIHMWARIGP